MSVSAYVSCLVALAAACGFPRHKGLTTPSKTVIINARVFNGTGYSQPAHLVLVGQQISNANPSGGTIVDAQGGYLLPGFIDGHCHVQNCSDLTLLRQYGVTTALDMGTYPYSFTQSCNGVGITNVLGTGQAGTVNGSTISLIPGTPSSQFIPNVTAGEMFVKNRVAEGVQWIKVFLDLPDFGPTPDVLTSVVETAHQNDRLVVTHAPSYADYQEAYNAAADLICHAPLDKVVDAALNANLTNAQRSIRAIVPTLIMMQSIVNNTGLPYSDYVNHAEASVTSMLAAGVDIVLGTDANTSPYVPANPPFGLAFHQELKLLVAAGLTPLQAINAGTVGVARAFQLYDRGIIETGLRADLVLLSKDPLQDISNSCSIQKVWVAGVEYSGPF
ncbi:hypothetical protein LTR82_015139 [Friedmanniomyces endolithicus]|uniref:Amidohydrolase-related domain-containing protein n=1 Tax=Friedmanniomyces endolithicus TaxID=329885 RepID=A0AAN6F8S9_9PEZI|nr:hypothetical protein LTR82_015139 [Friedmanniomyces endolithicus]